MDASTRDDGQGQREASHPIDALMRTAMESIKAMVDVNTILGVPVEAPDGTVIIPVSRVSFGFVAGGSEFETAERSGTFPFGGGSGAGVSLHPVAFLVVGQGQVRLLPVSERALYDRLLDIAPRVVEQVQRWMGADGRTGGPVDGAGSEGRPDARRAKGRDEADAANDDRARDAGGRHGGADGRASREPVDRGHDRLTLQFE